MSRVMIDDLWLKRGAPSRVKRSLVQARDPLKARVPVEWRAAKYGRGLRWRCRWYQPSPDGERQKSKSFERREDAEAFAAAMEDDVRRGRYHDPSQEQRLFADVASEWLKSKVDLRASTADRYRRELTAYINPTWGDRPLRAITTEGVQEWVSQLMDGTYKSHIAGGRRSPRALSPASIRNVVKIVMGGVMGYAVQRGWVVGDPVSAVRLPKVECDRGGLGILSVVEVEGLAGVVGRLSGRRSLATLVRFLAYTGVRVGEATALLCGDVDLCGLRARVRRTWSDTGGGRQLALPKNGRARSVALPASLRGDLAVLMRGQGDSVFLFRNSRGGALNSRNFFNRVWKPALKVCGLDGQGITIHSLRHTYASLAIAHGADVKTLQTQLGHSSATITLDTYASLWPDRLDEVETAVDAARVEVLHVKQLHVKPLQVKAGLSKPGHDSDTIAAQKPSKSWTSAQNRKAVRTA